MSVAGEDEEDDLALPQIGLAPRRQWSVDETLDIHRVEHNPGYDGAVIEMILKTYGVGLVFEPKEITDVCKRLLRALSPEERRSVLRTLCGDPEL